MRWPFVLLAACSFEHGMLPPTVDAPRDDAPPIDPDSPPAAWSTPVEITELTSLTEDDPSLTDDLLEIYFGTRRAPNVGEDIWTASRMSPSDPWGQPVPATALNTTDSETTARVTGDGLAIFFTRSISNNADLYFSTRATRTSVWSVPQRIDELSLTSNQEYGPYVRADLLQMVFCRGNSPSNEALWLTTRASKTGTWETPTVIVELNEAAVSECDPILRDDRVLYYASNRTADGRYDIYRSERIATAPFDMLVPVDEVNLSGFNDRDPWVSADERYMVFSSDRVGGDFRLYLSTR